MNVKRLRIPSQILMDVLFSEKHFDLSLFPNADIPSDAKAISVLAVPETLSVDLILFSSKFPPVSEGCHIPFVNASLTKDDLNLGLYERPEITRNPIS